MADILQVQGSCLLILLLSLISQTEPKDEYVMPMSMGMKMSIPYDIANIFIMPIAGVASVVISVSLLIIIFFGVITSPFGYMFGIPSKKYVTGGIDDEATPRLFDSHTENVTNFQFPDYNAEYVFFNWMDPQDSEIEDCRLLALCFAHGAMKHLPKSAIQLYSLFSSKLANLRLKYRRAILQGLRSADSCSKQKFSQECPQSGFSLIVKFLRRLLPEGIKNRSFRKRKGAMYLHQ